MKKKFVQRQVWLRDFAVWLIYRAFVLEVHNTEVKANNTAAAGGLFPLCQ